MYGSGVLKRSLNVVAFCCCPLQVPWELPKNFLDWQKRNSRGNDWSIHCSNQSSSGGCLFAKLHLTTIFLDKHISRRIRQMHFLTPLAYPQVSDWKHCLVGWWICNALFCSSHQRVSEHKFSKKGPGNFNFFKSSLKTYSSLQSRLLWMCEPNIIVLHAAMNLQFCVIYNEKLLSFPWGNYTAGGLNWARQVFTDSANSTYTWRMW